MSLELLLGALIGTVSSILISHFYYIRSSKEFEDLISKLNKEIITLSDLVEEVQHSSFVMFDSVEVVKKSVTENTINDSNYPYK